MFIANFTYHISLFHSIGMKIFKFPNYIPEKLIYVSLLLME